MKDVGQGASGGEAEGLGVGAGFIFKGSGFYITDYRSEGYKSKAKGDVAPAASSTGSKTETKAADKPGRETVTQGGLK